MVKNGSAWVYGDRLGSIGKYYPYGQERPSATQNGTEKFTGYLRDAETGLDYADQRYYQPGMGRFLTADPYMANNGGSGEPSDPGSWNRFAYVGGDPVNLTDPDGRFAHCPDGTHSNGSVCLIDDPGPPPFDTILPKPVVRRGGGGAVAPSVPYQQCNRSGNPIQTTDLQFIIANYAAAVQVATTYGVPTDWVLAWAAQESGSVNSQGYGQGWGTVSQAVNQNNFFGQTTGAWNGAVACSSSATAGYACFSSFAASAAAAFSSFNGRYGNILTADAAAGDSAKQAFQDIAKAGWNPNPTGYGAGVSSAVTSIDSDLECLKSNGYLKP